MFFAERYEVSRTWSPFNEHVTARGNDEGGMTSFQQGKRFRRTAEGYDETDLVGDALGAALVAELGMSEEIVAAVAKVLPGL